MLWDKLVDKSEELLEHLVNSPEKELPDGRLRELSEKMQQPGYAGQKLKEQQGFDYHPAFQQHFTPVPVMFGRTVPPILEIKKTYQLLTIMYYFC